MACGSPAAAFPKPALLEGEETGNDFRSPGFIESPPSPAQG